MAFTPVQGTISSLSNSLKRIYDPEFFELAQNVNAPFYKYCLEAKNIEADGEGYFWPFYLGTPHSMGFVAEVGDQPPVKQRIEVQARVRPVQLLNSIQLSFIMYAVGTKNGTFGKAEIKRQMWEAVTDSTKHLNRVMAGSHGSGRLGQVLANTSSSTSFYMKFPLGAWLVRPNMLLDVYTADTGGTLSSGTAATQMKVTDVNYATGLVTTDTSVSLNANEGVYNFPDYGNAPNGLAGLVDDGTLLTTIHNQSRSSYPQLKATVLSNGGTLRPLTEEMLIDLTSQVIQTSGEELDTFILNRGQIRQYLRFVIPNRRYNLDGKGVPDYTTGYKGQLQFMAGGKIIDLMPMEDVSPRVIYGISKRLIRRFESQKLDWYQFGGPEGGVLTQGIGTNGPNTTHRGTIFTITNIGYLKPNGAGLIKDLLDPQMCGDAQE